MKKLIASLILTAATFSSFGASDVTPDIDNPVAGLLGASFVDPEASPFNLLGLTSLNGSSYRGIADYMKARSIHNPRGIVYRELAEGGSSTNGQDGFLSLFQQAERMVEHTTMWSDGTHLDVAVIFQFNDCLHTLAGLCDEQDVLAGPVQNVIDTVNYLQANGVKVFVTNLVKYDDFDLPLVEDVFSQIIPGFQVASEAQYNLYVDIFETEVAALPGVTMIDVWKKFEHIGDGLHPNYKSHKKASKILHKAIRQHLKMQ